MSDDDLSNDCLTELARAYLDLWRDRLGLTIRDTGLPAAIGRLYAQAQAGSDELARGFEEWSTAWRTAATVPREPGGDDDGSQDGRPSPAATRARGAAPPGVAHGGGNGGLDERPGGLAPVPNRGPAVRE